MKQYGISYKKIFDARPERYCNEYQGCPVERPTKSNIIDVDAVLVLAVFYFEDIKRILADLGYEGKIISLKELIDACCQTC